MKRDMSVEVLIVVVFVVIALAITWLGLWPDVFGLLASLWGAAS